MEKTGNTVIVFCGRRADSVKLSLMLRELGLSAVALHGQMSQVVGRLTLVVGVYYITGL